MTKKTKLWKNIGVTNYTNIKIEIHKKFIAHVFISIKHIRL